MPVRDHPTQKKRKVEASSRQTYKYTSASEIRRVFNSQSESGLIEGLTALRNQLTVRPSELPVQVNDERLLLARQWLEEDPGAQELLAAWEGANARQTSLLGVLVGVLSALLNLLSSHYTYHAYAQPILRTLLSQQWAHHLNLYLSGQHTDLVLVTLKLFNSMSNFAGGRERKAVLDAFAWEMKSLPKLLHMRRKSKFAEDVDMLLRPDIRTLYVLLVLSFIDSTTPSAVKATFLEQHRDAFISIFKGLSQDPYSVIRRVLEVCWSGLWSDAKLKRTLKIQVFSEATLSQLLRIYERNIPEGLDAESIPADVVHHFLLALCSRPGAGLCFHNRGWYPREIDADQRGVGEVDERTDTPQRGGKIYNKILANVLKTLKVNEDPRQQELALKILAACPELISGYWTSVGLALEPRLSSKWLANIAFFGAVVSLPVPTSSFFLPESGGGSTSLYQPSPPPLLTIVENILPTAHIKIHLSRGLQASSPLVQHASSLALAKSLLKYEQVVCAFQEVERALEEDEEEGLWARRRREVEREVRKRTPDFQVVVGFSQRLNDAPAPAAEGQGKDKQKETAPNPTRTALLAESAHRLLWLYHRLLPSVVAEARFDAGKLLQAIEDMLSQGSDNVTPTGGLDTLRQLHVLRLLRESEHFTWAAKSGPKHSNFHILLKAYTTTPVPAVRTAIVGLLRHILAPGVLFQHDPDEIALWLDALPLTHRAPGARAPDGAPLADEGGSVIPFFDDCVQRCVKTPYKYVEELQAMDAGHRKSSGVNDDGLASSISQRPEAFPSPLLATVVEQLAAKLKGKLLSPSDALALFSFVRKVLLRMCSKSTDLVLPGAFVARISALMEGQILFSKYPTMEAGLQREISLLASIFNQIQNPAEVTIQAPSSAVQAFLDQVEGVPEPDSDSARRAAAYELVDWVRLIGPELHSSELSRLIAAVEKFHAPALKELFQYLDPRLVSFWEGANITTDFSRLSQVISFDTLFLHCASNILSDEVSRNVLVDSVFASHFEGAEVKRAVRLILHRLLSPTSEAALIRDLLYVLSGIVDRLLEHRRPLDASGTVLLSFDSDAMKSFSAHAWSGAVRQGLDRFLNTCSKVGGDDITQRFTQLTGRWILVLRESLDNLDEDQRATALLWFKHLSAREALDLLGYLTDRAEHSSSAASQEILGEVMDAVAATLSDELDVVTDALSLFCRLQAIIPQSPQLTTLIASGIRGCLPLCHDTYISQRPFSDWSVASLMPSATKRWSLRLKPTPALSVASLLVGEHMSDTTVNIVTDLLYLEHSSRPSVADWLQSPASKSCNAAHLVSILFAFYDSAPDGQLSHTDAIQVHFPRVVKVAIEARHPWQICSMAINCIVSMVASSAPNRTKFLKQISKEVASLLPEKLSSYCLSIGKLLVEAVGAEAIPLAEQLLDLGLKWAVRYFGDSETSVCEGRRNLSLLASLIRANVPVKSHLAEPVITTVIQDCLRSADAVTFARLLASSTHLKPVIVNRFLQTVVQHVKFYEYCAISSSNDTSPRDGIIDFLHILFHLHPTNTCQPSHIEPLRKIYGGSLSAPDLQILTIFQLFEATRKTPVTSLLSEWSMTPDMVSGNALEAISSLDGGRVLKTCLEFPEWRALRGEEHDCAHSNGHLYDPVFVLLLFSHALVDTAPASALAWVQLFRTNVVSLILRTLSAKNAQIREVAWAQIAALYRVLEHADMQEKPHILHILNLLKDLQPSAPLDEVPRLPAFATLLLAHALRGIFYPSNFIYPITARFLLQRPTVDPTDVPMLYGMLYSSSDDWKKERAWIVRFLSDGIVGNEEWRILKRRHTWDLLASLFQSEERDRTLRRGVLEVLANVTCSARATTSLILRNALLPWIEMQLQTMRSEETIAWVRILENILTVINAAKVEAATGGEWRAVVSRCLRAILHHPACSRGVFAAAVPVLLRLCTLPGRPTSHVPALLEHSMRWLTEMEGDVAVPTPGYLGSPLQDKQNSRPQVVLRRSQHLLDLPPSPSIELWGECVESLWRVSMVLSSRTPEWDGLSSRLLIWRSIAGRERSRVGEWARREVLENLVAKCTS